jgi:hypothetical protein
MMRGIYYAIDDRDLQALRSQPGDREKVAYVSEVIDAAKDSNFATETEKAWGLIHSALTRTSPCAECWDLDTRTSALGISVIGKEDLLSPDATYMIGLVPDTDVPNVRDALDAIQLEEFEDRLRSLIDQHQCEHLGEGDVEYAGYWFDNLKAVYRLAAEHGRHVLFT